MKLFEITDYNKDNKILTVDLSTGNRCHIPLLNFETWLIRSERLQWIADYPDHNGEHVQEAGIMSLEQYWEMSHHFIHADIYDFIVIHFVDDSKSIQQSLKKITDNYGKTTNVV